MKDKRRSEEFRKHQSEIMKEIARKNWENPEYREKQLAERRKRKYNKDFVEKMTKVNREKFVNDNVREKISKTQKKKFSNRERREQHRQMTIETAKQRSKKMKENWNDPFFVYRIMKNRFNVSRALDVIEKRFGIETRTECEKILKNEETINNSTR